MLFERCNHIIQIHVFVYWYMNVPHYSCFDTAAIQLSRSSKIWWWMQTCGRLTNWVWWRWWWFRQWWLDEALSLIVWWHASLKMTKCKNCLEVPNKYVWNWIFKEDTDREIHHHIVKCRNTIKVWIFSIIFFSCCYTECYRQENTKKHILILHVTSSKRYFSCFALNT